MATNHTCISFTDSSGRDFKIIQTAASNIKLRSYADPITLRDEDLYGMNGSFFNTSTNKLLNIAYQDGVCIGNDVDSDDGYRNSCGTSLISWTGSVLRCNNSVTTGASTYVPKTANSWAQGGIGLFLCDSNWSTRFHSQAGVPDDIDGGSARSGILINTSTKQVYLFMTRILTTIVSDLRSAMMQYAGLTEGGSAGSWAAIMVDGGRSAQLRGESINSYVSVLPRAVPQVITLKSKT